MADTVKVCLVGNSSVGKTCLIKKFVNDTFDENEKPTVNEEHHEVEVTLEDGSTLQLRIHDRPGEQDHTTATQTYFKGAHAVVAVYAKNDGKSFEDLDSQIEDAMGAVKKPDDVVLAIVGNKSDHSNQEVDGDEASEKAEEEDALFKEVSAKTGDNVSDFFKELAEKIFEQMG